MAGSCSVGNDSILGGNAGVADHVKIGNNVMAGGKSGITGDIEDGSVVSGFPAIDTKLWKRQMLALQKLPSLIKEIRELKKNTEKN